MFDVFAFPTDYTFADVYYLREDSFSVQQEPLVFVGESCSGEQVVGLPFPVVSGFGSGLILLVVGGKPEGSIGEDIVEGEQAFSIEVDDLFLTV